MEAFRITNLTFSYPHKDRPTLSGISLSVRQGDFVTLCGKSGSGKSTLLRHLKSVLTPHGVRSGEILFCGKPLEAWDQRAQASQIGYVLQSPENQIVTDKVWHELAFGLESLGVDTPTIRLRVAEMASFFGIQTWFHKNVSELSGGQKQLLNLAAVMAMQPSVLILDEPTSQLDPIAASEFLETVKKINTELGTTVILSEQRLEEVFPLSDRVFVLDAGTVLAEGTPSEVGALLKASDHAMFLSMPTAMQVYAQAGEGDDCPITVRDGRRWLSSLLANTRSDRDAAAVSSKSPYVAAGNTESAAESAIALKNVWFRYGKNLPDIIKDLSLDIPKAKLTCIVGGNGTGKTTALRLAGGMLKPYRGKVRRSGRIAMLPQNPQVLFVEQTVELDLFEILSDSRMPQEEKAAKVAAAAETAEVTGLLQMHPYDLSGGEQQRAALAKILLLDPEILLLDEPTKGMDAQFKQKFSGLLQNLKERGVTIVMVSHDVEFCAKYADLCTMFFDGSIVSCSAPRAFFAGNSFYTTAANRMARHLSPDTVTIEDVIRLCKQGINPPGGASAPGSPRS